MKYKKIVVLFVVLTLIKTNPYDKNSINPLDHPSMSDRLDNVLLLTCWASKIDVSL